MKEKQKKRKAYEPKLTQEELMDSSTFKRFLTSIDNILDNLEDVDFTTMGKHLNAFQHLNPPISLVVIISYVIYIYIYYSVHYIFVSCFSPADDDEIPQELLLGKHQLNELGSESAKIKAMGISSRVWIFVFLKIPEVERCTIYVRLNF